MKRISICFTLILAYWTVTAQITLNQNAVGAIGSEYILGIDTNASNLDLQLTGGANLTWDFSDLQGDAFDTIRFEDPANTPFASSFPAANLSIYQSDIEGYAYFTSSSTALELIGLAGDPAGIGMNFVVPQDNPRTIARFPFTYGTTLSDTASFDITIDAMGVIPYADSIRYRSTSYRELEGDAFGDLQLTQSSYTTLRVREVNVNSDSIWALFPFIGWQPVQDTTYTDSTFTWWDNTKGYLLCEARFANGNLQTVQHQDPLVVSRAPAQTFNFDIFPNPSSGELYLRRSESTPGNLIISDLTGKVLRQESLRGPEQHFDLKSLSAGTYLIRIEDGNGQAGTARRLVIQH